MILGEEAGYQRINNEPDENIGEPNKNICESNEKLEFKIKFDFLIIGSLIANVFILFIGIISFLVNLDIFVFNWNEADLKIKSYFSLFFSNLIFELIFGMINIYLLWKKKNEKKHFAIWLCLFALNSLFCLILCIFSWKVNHFFDILFFYNIYNVIFFIGIVMICLIVLSRK